MHKLQRKKLGNSDMSITSVGFGAWAIGGSGWEFGWGPQDDVMNAGTLRLTSKEKTEIQASNEVAV